MTAVAKNENVSTEVEAAGVRTVGAITTNTFADETREDQIRLYLALDAAKSLKKEKKIDTVLLATNLIIRDETYVDPDTGRVSDAPSVTIETEDGTSYYMSSHSLAESALNVATAFRAETWAKNPMPVKVVEGLSAKSRTFFRMVPAA